MTRTLSQNNFYFALIADIHSQALAKHITVENSEYLRNGLKDNDDNYPPSEDNYFLPMSSSKLTTKQMTEHIEFIIKFVGEVAGITPKFVEEEFDRLFKSHGVK